MEAPGEFCRTAWGVEYSTAVCAVLCWSAATGIFLRCLDSFTRPGPARVIAVLPVVMGNVLAPKLFCKVDAITIILVGFNTAWLTSFKALAWALNRGPLADPRLTALQFVATFIAPLTPKQVASGGARKGRLAESAGSSWEMLLAWLGKYVMLGGVVWSLARYDMPGVLRSFVMTLGLWGLLSSIMDGPAALLTGLLGLELSPHFDKPFLASSYASFWNKRWDLAAGNTLRTLVYDPIVEGRLVVDPRVAPALNNPWRMLGGTFASFLVSGLIHEGVYWLMVRRTTGGLWMLYFTSQAVLIALERVILAALKRWGVQAPHPLRVLWVVTSSVLVAHWLFWPPIEGEVVEQVVGNLSDTFAAVGQAVGIKAARTKVLLVGAPGSAD